ncbi:MAG: GTP-binding protein [Cyanothece sp. SIO1E1]|nr:GTP-binding protein [Cyanothece sp. SIO1E1]
MLIISKKICFLGDFAVGKTSLIRRFIQRKFSGQYLSTVGVRVSQTNIQLAALDIQTNQSLELILWDMEGGSAIENPSASYFHEADGTIIVADIRRPQTINNISRYIDLFSCFNPKKIIIIALNKIDLVHEADLENFLSLACLEQNNFIFSIYRTSAKTGENVDAVFRTLISHLVNHEWSQPYCDLA